MAYLTSFAREHSHLSRLNIDAYRLLHSISVSMILSEACVTVTWWSMTAMKSIRLASRPVQACLAARRIASAT